MKFRAGIKIKAISAGLGHGLAITTKGHLLSWGFNEDGQQHSLAVSTTGQLYGWGFNEDGEIGDGTTMDRSTPVAVSLDGPFRPGPPARSAATGRSAATVRIVSLVAGCFHSLALLSNGFVLSWGDNSLGQLGDGKAGGSDVPVRVAVPPGNKVTAISAGCANGLALTGKGRVLAWGDNSVGELGNSMPGHSNVPVRVALAAGLRATSIGGGPRSRTFFAIVHAR